LLSSKLPRLFFEENLLRMLIKMKTIKSESKILTQTELVRLLQKQGFEGVNVRQIADWRKRELLPDFDYIGGGRGKGNGRTESGWLNRRAVIKQARRILHLRTIYPSFDDLYFPLWVSGYQIPNDRIREILSEPLDFLLEDIGEMINRFSSLLDPESRRTGGIIEDIIDDVVYTSPVNKALRAFDDNEVPPETIEAGMNIFLNPYYKLNNINFRNGLLGLKRWSEKNRKKQAEAIQSEAGTQLVSSDDNSTIEFIFKYAPFLKENLSLHRLAETMAACSDEDLEEIRRDLRIVSEIAAAIGEMTIMLMQHSQEKFGSVSLDGFLPPFFGLAKLIAWTDISLRQRGFSEIINHLRREVPKKIRQDLTEEKKLEMARFSPQFAVALEDYLSKLEKSFKDLGLEK